MAAAKHWILAALVACLAGAVPADGVAQGTVGGGLHVSPEQMAIKWLEGRFRSPLTCTLPDGSRVELEESVVFRPDFTAGRASIRATFFGIDGDFTHCFNLVEPNIPDRRGTLYLHFRAHTRADTGQSEFNRLTRDGLLTYHVHGGSLQIRELGAEPAEPRTVSFESGDPRVEVQQILAGSDADKLLDRYKANEAELKQPRKRFSFLFRGPDDFSMQTHMIEDEKRRNRRQGRRN